MPNFEELKINKSFVKSLTEKDIVEATEIQQKAIPIIRGGSDVIGVAQTGTGKTLAYLLPLLSKLRSAEGFAPRAIVLVPTRELALQVKEHADEACGYSDIRSVAFYGGIGITKQTALVEEMKGVDLVISTPGRLWDVYKTGIFNFKLVKTMVFDEADRILDMGFVPQIRKLLEVIPPKRQNLLFSATFSDKLEGMAAEFLTFPERVEVAPSATPASRIEQFVYRVANLRSKLFLLEHLLRDEALNRVMIFCRTKDNADAVANYLERKEVNGTMRVIHSNKGQNSRINAIEAFKQGELSLLVSTDVSARGIDVEKVSHVINFDVPTHYEDYIHRIGRTGRVQESGVAISFVNAADVFHLRKIEALMNHQIRFLDWPDGVPKGDFIPGEQQIIEREVDRQKQLENPDYQGAFHERKSKKKDGTKGKTKKSTKSKPGGRRGR